MNNNKPQLREIILDTETTGLSPAKGDRIVEIACLEMINKKLTGKKFHRYINPEYAISPHAYKVHGLSNEFLSDKPVFSDIAQELIEFLKNSTLIIHNAPFDMRFLTAELEKTGLAFHGKIVDTLTMAKSKLYKQSASLDNLCKIFNIDSSSRETHGALIDVELLAKVYLKLIEA